MRRLIYGTMVGILFSLIAYLFNSINPVNNYFFYFIIVLQGIAMGWMWHIGATSNYDKGFEEGIKSKEKKNK